MRQGSSKNCIQIKSTNEKQHNLTIHEYSRWLCLIEALDHVSVKAKQLKHDIEKTSDWIKPLSFQKYITERYDTMIEEVAGFENVAFEINITDPTLCTTSLEPVLQSIEEKI
jgi:deoxyadenosine/deoxycytidine kinase